MNSGLLCATRAGDAARCRQLGVTIYLIKAISAPELLRAIRSSLSDKRARPASVAPAREPVTPPRHDRCRILLAEDNRVNQRLARALLERDGHSVTVVDTGTAAVAAATAATPPFDLVLMDIQMPEMSGLEAAAAIRRHELTGGRRLPIVAMTAHAMEADRERCLKAGMDDYVSKPIRIEALRAALNRVRISQDRAFATSASGV